MDRPRVLIVEENRRTVGELHDKFEINGYEAEVALNGQLALSIIHEREMDVAVLDHEMSGFREWELVRKLKSKAPALPIVLINGPREKGIARVARRAGATRYMRSPVNLDRVVSAVDGLLPNGNGAP